MSTWLIEKNYTFEHEEHFVVEALVVEIVEERLENQIEDTLKGENQQPFLIFL